MKLVLLFLFWLIRPGFAIFEDQIGNLDWYKQYVGTIEDMALYTHRPRVCVQTTRSVVGCLNLRDGDIAWRKQYPVQPKGVIIAEASNIVLTVSDGILKALDNEGALKWERDVVEKDSVYTVLPLLDESKVVQSIVFVSGNNVKIIDTLGGTVVEVDEDEINKPLQHAFGNNKRQSVVSYEEGKSELTLLPIEGEAAGKAATVPSPTPLSSRASAAEDFLAILSADLASVCVVTHAGVGVSCTPLDTVAPALAGAADLAIRAAGTGVLLSSASQGKATFLKLIAGGDTPAAAAGKVWDDISIVTPPAESTFLGLVSKGTKPGALLLRVLDTVSGEVVATEEMPAPQTVDRLTRGSAAPVPSRAVLGAFKRKDKSLGFRLVVSLSDGQLLLLQQGQVVWHRDEALADLAAPPLFVDLPAPSHGLAKDGTPLSQAAGANLTERFRYQLLSAKVQIRIASPDEAREHRILRERLSEANSPIRDVNGFRKLVLALTTAGKLTAFHNGDGRVIWTSIFGSEATAGQKKAASAPLPPADRLLSWRTFHDVSHAPQALLLRTQAPAAYAAIVDAHTGDVLSRTDFGSAGIDQVVPIHEHLHDGTAEQSLYLLVSYDGVGNEGKKGNFCDSKSATVRLLPDTPDARAYFAKNFQRVFFWTQAGDSALCGYGFDAAGAAAEPLKAVQTWLLPFSTGAVLATAARDPTEPIPSSVKVWHDRTIKYKYVRPNVVFVAVGRANGEPVAADEDPGSLELTTYLVDTVTGAVLYSQTHLGARGPATAVLSENLLVYTFWDMAAARYVATTQELYDATPRAFSVLDYLFNPNSTQPVSSFAPAPVEAVGQVFFLAIHPRRLYVTATRQGITLKQILIQTNTDQVYTMDRRFLNPRRPKKAKLSQEEVEEGLTPYQELLPYMPAHYLTLDKQVVGLKGVAVHPARLESTCHVLAYGLDVFYTRMRPALGFDSLDEDFNYALLVVALLGLGLGSFALNHVTKRALLKKKWK